MPLETVDIPAVEILASGGPVFAIGSPPEGDFYSREELEGIAEAHVELGNEIRAPIKLGHSDRQQLLANTGLTKGEMPAAGWLDSSSFRVVDDDETGVSKLLADAKAVPKKLAELMKAGAYRTRSSEIREYASQATQKTYDWVVDGIALLGEQIPAIQTLDDVYRLYERAEFEKPEGDRTFVVRYNAAAAPVIWDSEDALEDLRSDLNEALNPFGFDAIGVTRFWVRDVARSSNVALVSEGYSNDDDAWVVPFTIDANGEPVPAPRDQWTAAEMTWVAASADLARRNSLPAESRLHMPEITLTDEAAVALREQLGLEADAEITAENLVEASTARANELAEAKKVVADAEARKNEASDLTKTVRKLESDLKVEQTKRFEMERDTDLKAAVREAKIDPADLEEWSKDYERDQEGTRRVLARLKADPTLVRELGRDEDDEDGDADLNDEEYKRDFERRMGQKATV